MITLDTELTETEAPANIAVMTPTTEIIASMTMAEVKAIFAVAFITGNLKWVSPALGKDGCQSIAILRDDESATVADGRLLLTGIKLTKDVTARFSAEYGNTIFLGSTLTVEVRTDDVEKDISAGRGRSGHSYFIGQAITYTP